MLVPDRRGVRFAARVNLEKIIKIAPKEREKISNTNFLFLEALYVHLLPKCEKVSLCYWRNVSQFGTIMSRKVFTHSELGFGRLRVGFYFTITSGPPRQNFISPAVTQKATVN